MLQVLKKHIKEKFLLSTHNIPFGEGLDGGGGGGGSGFHYSLKI